MLSTKHVKYMLSTNQRESCLSLAPLSAGKFAISIPAKPRLSGQTEKGLSASNVV